MKRSVTYNRWDVVVVPYPFVEGYEAKHRPALIVSADAFYQAHGVYWTAMITTAKAGKRAEDIPITDSAKAGLPADCVIRVARLTTLGDQQVLRRTGTIPAGERRAVSAFLKRYLP